MKGYFYSAAGEGMTEISRGQAESIVADSGIENPSEYCDQIEAGKFGHETVLVAVNIYYGEMED